MKAGSGSAEAAVKRDAAYADRVPRRGRCTSMSTEPAHATADPVLTRMRALQRAFARGAQQVFHGSGVLAK